MMKKRMIILLFLLLTLGSTLTACGKKTETPAEKATSSTQPVSTEQPTQATEPENDITYTYSDNTLTVKGKGILTSDFFEKNNLSKDGVKNVIIENGITIPDSVTEIGSWAFSGCTNLTTITIPDSVTEIRYKTFADCKNLTVTIPNSVLTIDSRAFSGCNLNQITIPDSVETLEPISID